MAVHLKVRILEQGRTWSTNQRSELEIKFWGHWRRVGS